MQSASARVFILNSRCWLTLSFIYNSLNVQWEQVQGLESLQNQDKDELCIYLESLTRSHGVDCSPSRPHIRTALSPPHEASRAPFGLQETDQQRESGCALILWTTTRASFMADPPLIFPAVKAPTLLYLLLMQDSKPTRCLSLREEAGINDIWFM